jgi:hypothetical protein
MISMMTMETTQEEVTREYILGPKDRCDQCGAEALVIVKLVTGQLIFCGHHYKNNESALEKFAYEIIDERDKLIENKSKEQDY